MPVENHLNNASNNLRNGSVYVVFDPGLEVTVTSHEIHDPNMGGLIRMTDPKIVNDGKLRVASGDSVDFETRGKRYKAKNYRGRAGHAPGGVIRREMEKNSKGSRPILATVSQEYDVKIIENLATVFWKDD